MDIPDKATEALRAHVRETFVLDHMGEDGADWYADEILKLVTPLIAAQALRDYADAIILELGLSAEWVVEETVADIRLHADALEKS